MNKSFLIQTINGEVVHDFSFTLIEAIKYKNWYENSNDYKYKLSDSIWAWHPKYIPIGTVEFVTEYLKDNHGLSPKPINVPSELFKERFLKRKCFIKETSAIVGNWFVKSMDEIKGFTDIVHDFIELPEGRYFVSEVIDIESEWRAFVFKKKLVGLQNYSGDFTQFPNVDFIEEMITEYKSSPIAYTLDVGITNIGNVLIEVHDMFSVGFYGFSDLRIIPDMFSLWFEEYIERSC